MSLFRVTYNVHKADVLFETNELFNSALQ